MCHSTDQQQILEGQQNSFLVWFDVDYMVCCIMVIMLLGAEHVQTREACGGCQLWALAL